MSEISEEVKEVLRGAEISGNSIRLTRELDRKLYEAVNKVIERLGGKWNRSKKVHIFSSDPTERIKVALESGTLDPKEKIGYFPTPHDVARRMVQMLDLKISDQVLEPSAGQGAILEHIPKSVGVWVGEIMPENIQILKEKGYKVDFRDFMTANPPNITKVVMNPPFENQKDIDHVLHALYILQPGGTLVSVMASGIKFRENSKTKNFLDLLDRSYEYEIIDLPAGTFKESGTNVNAVLLKVKKPLSKKAPTAFVPDSSLVSKKLADRPAESPKFITQKPDARPVFVSTKPDALVSVTEKPEVHYTYYFRNRPPDIGTFPTKGIIMHEAWDKKETPKGNLAWGFAVYDRELSPEEQYRYELFVDEIAIPKPMKELIKFAFSESIDDAMKEIEPGDVYSKAIMNFIRAEGRERHAVSETEQIRDELLRHVQLAGKKEKPVEKKYIPPTYELYEWSLTLTPHLEENSHFQYKVAQILPDGSRKEFSSFGSRYFGTWEEAQKFLASGSQKMWVHDMRGDYTVSFKPTRLELPEYIGT